MPYCLIVFILARMKIISRSAIDLEYPLVGLVPLLCNVSEGGKNKPLSLGFPAVVGMAYGIVGDDVTHLVFRTVKCFKDTQVL